MRHPPSFPTGLARQCRTWASLCALVWLSACASPYSERASDPPFGETVRRALQAQELPPSPPTQPAGVAFTELEPALERQQKAKPPETSQNRGGQSGSWLMGQ